VFEIKRVLPAVRTVVFAAFTDPAELARWCVGPAGYAVANLEFDPRVGQSYRIEMQPPQGESFHLTGEFREVDPPKRLAYTFVWEPADHGDVETLAAAFVPEAGRVDRGPVHPGPVQDGGRRDLHREGLGDSFDKLERLLPAG